MVENRPNEVKLGIKNVDSGVCMKVSGSIIGSSQHGIGKYGLQKTATGEGGILWDRST
ncbi:conserved hypothetical protein [Ricinus communis]|uniref:Uncharacterized protein n=1 Tax=Ricinus communis TaxID=3988 RepID=B9SW79_RICCO|nr:conserved hypothetical protein [Ricinus communis]